jgi:hypothetical protein
MSDGPLVEVVLSPRWVLTNVVIDGAPHTVLRIQHPRSGPLDFLLAGNDAMDLAAALAKTAERRETAQMAGGVPIEPNHPPPDQTNQNTRSSIWSKIIGSKGNS